MVKVTHEVWGLKIDEHLSFCYDSFSSEEEAKLSVKKLNEDDAGTIEYWYEKHEKKT